MCVCFVCRCVSVVASPFFFFIHCGIFYFVLRDAVANASRRVQGPSVSVEDG